jgi:hypothetical protein
MEIFGYAPWGYEGDLVRVETDLRRGIPKNTFNCNLSVQIILHKPLYKNLF